VGAIIAVSSGKGGTGKSTVTAGLGAALCRQGRRVLLIDMDEGLRCLDLLLGVSDSSVFDVGDILNGNCNAAQAVLKVPHCAGLYVLTAPIKLGTIDNVEAMKFLCEKFSEIFDFVIIDSPAGIDRGFCIATSAAENALIVATPDPICMRDAALIDKLLEKNGVSKRRLVLNKINVKAMIDGILPNIDEMIDGTGIQLIAVVPTDPSVVLAGAAGKTIENSNAADAFTRLASRILNIHVPLPNVRKIT